MSRADAIARARGYLHSGEFLRELARRVAYQTESQNPDRRGCLRAYLEEELQPAFSELDFRTSLIESPTGSNPYLLAHYFENSSAPTVLMYGHGDVVDGMSGQWRDNLNPWQTTTSGNRVYGRGTADNKGQHSINLTALRAVREARGGRLGFNAKFIVETGEEIGSPDLRQVCLSLRDELKADLFLASDGPRLAADRPTIFLGCRGGLRIHLDVKLRDGSHHSGNWGGVLANPATLLAGAIAMLVDKQGRILLDDLKPPRLSNKIRSTLAEVKIEPTPDEPSLSQHWGEEGLSAAERLYAWNTLEVLAMSSGNIESPANAIPGHARAVLQLRFVVGTRIDTAIDAIRAHLHANGFAMVEVSATQSFAASRTDFDSPWINWAAQSIRQTTGTAPAVLPNFGGSLPNDVFSEGLGLPTIWVPHSYPGCSQHAPNEHMLARIAREGLQIMTGLFWDLGASGTPAGTAARAAAQDRPGSV
jgi:acetylornithine deacetylase/succinyl-diaminopimelate desuccinylase-like protein